MHYNPAMADCCLRWWGLLLYCVWAVMVAAQFEYHELDEFDQVEDLYHSITPENCHIKPRVSLIMLGGYVQLIFKSLFSKYELAIVVLLSASLGIIYLIYSLLQQINYGS